MKWVIGQISELPSPLLWLVIIRSKTEKSRYFKNVLKVLKPQTLNIFRPQNLLLSTFLYLIKNNETLENI